MLRVRKQLTQEMAVLPSNSQLETDGNRSMETFTQTMKTSVVKPLQVVLGVHKDTL